jgi:hypothetical protein
MFLLYLVCMYMLMHHYFTPFINVKWIVNELFNVKSNEIFPLVVNVLASIGDDVGNSMYVFSSHFNWICLSIYDVFEFDPNNEFDENNNLTDIDNVEEQTWNLFLEFISCSLVQSTTLSYPMWTLKIANATKLWKKWKLL